MLAPAELKAQLKAQAQQVEDFLAMCLEERGIPSRLQESMNYSLLAGGKRLRPVLCLTVASLFGSDVQDDMVTKAVMPFAAAIECIHTYSLIHDDLPAMDDDDLRRGKPSNHKQFDEATAILAGDGLLTDAFDFMASVAQNIPAANVLKAIQTMACAAGSSGMVGGQALDMEYTGRNDISLHDLRTMHAMKTGALLRASCVSGAELAGASAADVDCIARFGAAIGSAFQIVDDILDEIGDEAQLGKPVGSDIAQGKVTYPSLLGIDASRALAQEQVDIAMESLAAFKGSDALFLRSLAQYIVDRVQ
ncbi:MAG: farnesyl diphosphate synthase [Pseudomonadota bacterium]